MTADNRIHRAPGLWNRSKSGKRIARQLLILVLLAGSVGALNGWLNPSTPSWNPSELGEGEVSLEIVDSWGEPVLWIDARSEGAYDEAHIPGAVLLNMDRFDELLPGLFDVWQGDERLVVYCDSLQCGASEAVASRLREDMGMEEVFVLKGGWIEWSDASNAMSND